jgi:hypothetical protein
VLPARTVTVVVMAVAKAVMVANAAALAMAKAAVANPTVKYYYRRGCSIDGASSFCTI